MTAGAPRRPTVLLVEDSAAIRDAFGLLLEESGYRVVPAATAAEALRLAGAAPPDVVLLDVGLPDGDGLQVARELRARPATADLPIVAVTGHTEEEARDAALAAGCTEHVAKPVDTRALLRLLGDLTAAAR